MRNNKLAIGISLDGLKIHHDKVRKYWDNRGTYADIIRNIELLRRYEVRYGFLTVLGKHNVNDISDIVKFYYEIGCRKIALSPLKPYNKLKLLIEDDELIRAFKKATDLVIAINKRNNRKMWFKNIEDYLVRILTDTLPCFCHITPCGAGRRMIVITHRGEVYPCSEFLRFGESFRMGNIMSDKIDKMLFSKPVKKLRDRKAEEIRDCQECPYMHLCGCGCPALLIAKYGTYQRKGIFCKFDKAFIDMIFLLLSEDQHRLFLPQPFLESVEKLEKYYEVT